MGVTKPWDATPGTIRGDFGLTMGRNLVHGSDSVENAAIEVALFFDDGEFVNWQRETERWIDDGE